MGSRTSTNNGKGCYLKKTPFHSSQIFNQYRLGPFQTEKCFSGFFIFVKFLLIYGLLDLSCFYIGMFSLILIELLSEEVVFKWDSELEYFILCLAIALNLLMMLVP